MEILLEKMVSLKVSSNSVNAGKVVKMLRASDEWLKVSFLIVKAQ